MKLLKNQYDVIEFDGITIKEMGIKLDTEEQFQIKRQLFKLQYKTPFSSKIKLILHPYHDGIKGFLDLSAWDEKFKSQASGGNIPEVVSSLIEQMNEYVVEHKRKRFIEDTFLEAASDK